uniref:Programmed cell death protein 2 C-terminal domain-containing protein n=1 Tax=Amblyomma maculatum TaxID=34609 RepID=G3MRI7_AMBMU
MSADWLVGQDDWGDDSWDDESPHHMVHNSGAQNLEASLGSMTVTSPTVASVALLSNEEASGDTEMEEQTLVRAESLDSSRALENMCALRSSEGERKALLKDLQRVNSFKSFYIAVVEESTLPGETPADIRARKLLQDYEAGEGNVFRVPGKGQGNMTYAQEAYEKPQYSDTTFYRFNKRLRRCPQQLIRFCWEGEPLFISEPTSSWQPGTCESCGARRCFELQAMPALIQSLEVEAVTELQGPPVEFGTVLFYSCSASCWKDGDAWKSEVSLVQPDPDAAFWDKFG